ncbi:aminoacyl-histidine dipeptidase [Ferruginibacter sp. HRS2-29]|uniref:aminoacyl-histidine dipeptidase n=1 Tax=Ferruginibacter sp. HRS2-29 TaxID=2487334 RepID=UPI0020CE8F33|nr:aminoacyl-histidine dipeptidase [Ferruginibacter sp. HRS2-29]MCP9750340.1 aminoacyl-histidine dipeptidase [Ferruginibacter sp. HRS2-29]
MSDQIRQLEPTALWNHFADLNAVPRPSKKEQQVIEFIRSFGQSLGLETLVDEAGNVIIRKKATAGMEDKVPVIIQSHLDMVHQKNADTVFDFATQGIDMYLEGDWVKARGTTLGADNGIGVASIMTLLSSTDIPHPAIDALFTIDEETGMTGALELKGGLLKGKILLNLDTEDDTELTIGCAGGIDVTATANYSAQTPTGDSFFRISLKGLTGGHSGMDIHKGRANANKLMNRVLLELSNRFSIQVADIDGGSLRNAIPRESVATIVSTMAEAETIRESIKGLNKILQEEYSFTDPKLLLEISPAEKITGVLPDELQYRLLRAIYACPNGVYRLSPDIAGLVQTSNNIARVMVKDGNWTVQCLTRSSVDTEKADLANALSSAFELAGGSISYGGKYPGWAPKPGSPIVQLMSELYLEMNGKPAHVNAVHAGLECGIIGTNYPDVQMISFGPNITGAHSPDEKVQVSSVQKYWKFLLETLKRLPNNE